VRQAPPKLNLSYQEIEEKAKKVMEGRGHIAEGIDYWDYIQTNRWSVETRLGDKNDIIHGAFTATHNFKYMAFLCTSCEGIFCLPFDTNECMFCGHKEIKKDSKRIVMGTQGRAGVQDGVNPELYAMAVKDIQEHGKASNEPQFEPDWKYLEDNI